MSAKILRIEESDNLAKEFNYGVHTTLNSMFGLNAEPGRHRIELDCSLQADVSGIISLIQDKTEGTFIVSFPKETIFGMLAKMYRKDFTQVNESVRLGVGELTNIIYGVVKANLNKDGYSLKMAIPNVVIGEKHTVFSCAGGPALVMPYATAAGDFTAVMMFHSEGALAKSA